MARPSTALSLKETSIASRAVYAGQWGLVQIEAPAAWAIESGRREIVIADVGSGEDTNHPDLTGQLWVNPGEIPDNGLDGDDKGCVDDIHG